ncbi:MAG: SAM-dependent methyltransferase [Alphaproteobacteria bacterium]|nr:SAM-dependent methyltransferase [Alphaproteobacteria bacterium]
MSEGPVYSVRPVAYVRAGRCEPVDDRWDGVPARIELADGLDADALTGLDAFSHVEVLFLFHLVEEAEIELAARHPRGRADWPRIGIFAQRGKGRPNRLGATIARILKVEGRTLHVSGLDAVDGTPVLDLKPVMSGFLPRGEIDEPRWAKEIMADYW